MIFFAAFFMHPKALQQKNISNNWCIQSTRASASPPFKSRRKGTRGPRRSGEHHASCASADETLSEIIFITIRASPGIVFEALTLYREPLKAIPLRHHVLGVVFQLLSIIHHVLCFFSAIKGYGYLFNGEIGLSEVVIKRP